ncbi:Mitochondrial copper homeostasis protein [Tulasnella sp. 403]|nr:Mitochondrial copper homeostasis protein [Tulasnella sp. 403]
MSNKPLAPPNAPENQADNVHYIEAFKKREAYTKFVDPCAGASKASLKCLDQNNYNKSACTAYFEAYKECKKAWVGDSPSPFTVLAHEKHHLQMEERKRDRRAGKEVPV